MIGFIKNLFKKKRKFYVIVSSDLDNESFRYLESLSISPRLYIRNSYLYDINEEQATILKLKFQYIRIYERA